MRHIAIVKASGGHEWKTAINGTDQEIFNYFKVGTEINIGSVEDDVRVIESCKINIPLSYMYDSSEGYHIYQIANRDYKAAYCTKTKTWMWYGLSLINDHAPVIPLDLYYLNITQERDRKHEFKVSSPGIYETTSKCEHCGVEIVESLDPYKVSVLRDEECRERKVNMDDKTKADEPTKPKDEDTITIVWSLEDVTGQAENDGVTITEDQAREVLHLLKEHYDCNYGITWEHISSEIQTVTEETHEGKETCDKCGK